MKKKVLFVINTMGRAGAENAMAALLRQFEPDRYELHLYALIGRGEVFRDVPEYVTIRNDKPDFRSVHSPGAKSAIMMQVLRSALVRFGIFRNIPYLLRNYKIQRKAGKVRADKLSWKLISDGAKRFPERFDLAVAFIEGGATYYVAEHVKAARKCAFVHVDYKRVGYHPLIDNGCYDKMDRIFVVSDEVKTTFLSMYPQHALKTFLFHNMIDAARIRRLAQEQGGFEDGFNGSRILTIGWLRPQKGYENAVMIMKRLKEKTDCVRWYVIGEGEERKSIERLIREHGLEEDFILLGAKENPYPFLLQCDLYVHETKFEGKSIAITEAQILGKPVVASRNAADGRQIVDGVNGILTELDPDSASDGILEMLQNQSFREMCVTAEQEEDFADAKSLGLMLQLLEA